MKTNPLAEVMKDQACAYCRASSIQNQVYRFIGSDDRHLNLCNSCVIELRRIADGPILCAFCGRRAKYATWKLETTQGVGLMTYPGGDRVPEFWLLCEKHFSHLYRGAQERISQKQLDDF